MLKFGIMGFGQAGGNVAEYAASKNFVPLAINTARVDLNLLKYVPQDNKLLLKGYNGAGRNMDIGKSATVENAETILNMAKDKFKDCDCVFVSGAGGGGTGAGSLPVSTEILLDACGFVNAINIFPDDLESPSAKINAYDCFSQLSENTNIGSIFIIDNQKGKDLNSNLPKYKIHQLSNKQLIDYLYEINQLTNKASYTNNFDDRDLLDIIATRGCTLISKAEINVTKKIQDADISAAIQSSWENTYSPNYNLKTAVKTAILAKIKNEMSNKINLEKIFNGNIPYDIRDSFYNSREEIITVYSMFSGLQFPDERLASIKNAIEKVQDDLSTRLNTSQNQVVESMDWKINSQRPVLPITKKEGSLSDRLKKFK